jgi:stalled ribosome rescue protein Dom34
MAHHHVAVWLDHSEAKIFHVGAETFDEETIGSPRAHAQLHRKSGPGADSGRREQGDQHFYHDVASALAGAQEILIVGPSTAKLELIRYLHRHARDLEPRIVGVETVDHPTNGQLAAYVRRYFEAAVALRKA